LGLNEMTLPLQERHVKQAKDLYLLRCQLMNRSLSSCRTVSELERRLSIHLSILALKGVPDFSVSGRDAERFLFYALALQSQDEEQLYEACTLALEQLSDESLSDAPVFDAFTLFPPANELLLKRYRECRETRTALFSLWNRQGVDLPAGLINQAELQQEDLQLQCAVLTFSANNPSYGLDLFRAYYRPLLSSAGRFPLHETLLEPVLWGGLVRGDTEAESALRRAVEQVSAPEVRTRLLRLMALNGSPDHLPVLLESYERSSRFDSRWWTLIGMAECAPHLIQQIGQPELSEQAHNDWLLLTGVNLPERPALMLVDQEGERVDADPELNSRVRLVPDAHYAQSWLEANRAAWGEQRWIMGQPVTSEWLFELCREYTGDCIDDMTDLLALKLQQPLGIGGRCGWQALRHQAFDLLERSNRVPTRVSQSG
jgi:hypothetical protein